MTLVISDGKQLWIGWSGPGDSPPQTAREQGLGVIPLIQTFGHLEFVLKLEEWSHLREEAPYPQVSRRHGVAGILS